MTQRKKTWVLALIVFWLGYEAKDNRIFPLTHFYKRHFVDQPEPIKTVAQQQYNVFTRINTKRRIDCPKSAEVEVIVAIGQSNAANTGGHRFQNSDKKILNFFNGQCFIASDPMLGATENRGSLWIPFAQSYKQEKTILLVTFAMGATRVDQWLDPADLATHFDQNMAQLDAAGFVPDVFIWVQGESDISTKVSDYTHNLKSFLAAIKSKYQNSKIAISGSSYCGGHQSKALRSAQRKVARKLDLIWLGSTDAFNQSQYRYDDCHLSQQGLEKVAKQFSQVLRP